MGWLGLLKVVLSLANAIAGYVKDKQLLDAGAAQETARSLAQLQQRLGLVAQVDAEVKALTDADLNAALRGDQ
jgi:hypothetical protein